MKTISLLSLLFFTTILYSQNEYKGITIKAGISKPRYDFLNIDLANSTIKSELINKLNFNYGAEFFYTSGTFALKGGISLEDKGFKKKYTVLGTYQQPLNEPIPISSTLNARYFNANLSAGMNVLDKEKFNIAVYGTYSLGLLIISKETTVYDNEENESQPSNLMNSIINRRVNSYALSLDFNYYILPELGVVVSPFIQKDARAIEQYLIFATKFTLGTNIGVRYYIN